MTDATLAAPAPPAAPLADALKEWAVAIRALREGRQVMLLRKGGLLDANGEFHLAARRVLLFPTYLHEDEQGGSLQPCYGAWLADETRRRPTGEVVRVSAWAEITDAWEITRPNALYQMASQHIYSDQFLRFRIENEPHKPLYALFLRTYELPHFADVPMEPDYYGCKSWLQLHPPLDTARSVAALSDHTYNERVRVARRYLTQPTESTL